MAVSPKIKELQKQINLYKSIEKENKKFDKMSKANKRIAIAEDVLLSLRIKKYQVEEGTYLQTRTNVNEDVDAQACLLDSSTKCSVCAIGAIFTSKVKIGNKFDENLVNRELGGNAMIKNLRTIFTKKELRLIEVAFEGVQHGDDVQIPSKDLEKGHMFYEKYMNPTKRLKAIMENIIKNKGNFVL